MRVPLPLSRITSREGCRVDVVLPVLTSCRPVPHRTVQAVFPAYGSSVPVQRKSPVALSPIRIRSLAISPHLQVWLMFARLRSKTVEAFTPSALPDFSAIPASIPSHPSSVSPPFHSWSVILGAFQISSPRTLVAASFVHAHLCCSMPSATPEQDQSLVSTATALLPASQAIASACSTAGFRGFFRIQRLTLHLATSPQLRGSLSALGVEFSFSLFRLRDGFLLTPWLALPTSTRIRDG